MVIPDDRCYLEVAGIRIKWTEGKAFVFDDSFIHLVANPGGLPRTVLFFDFYHPDLTDSDVEKLKEIQTQQWIFEFLTKFPQGNF